MKTIEGIAVAAALIGGAAFAQAPAPAPTPASELRGFELALHTGFALPMGSAYSAQGQSAVSGSMSDYTSGQIPFHLDVGYRINQQFFAGAYFSFGIVPVKSSACSNASCSANDLTFGVEGQYHLPLQLPIDPYVGLGVGYERLHISESIGNLNASVSFTGVQFASLSAGFDYRLSPSFALGPLVNFSLGQYSSGSFDAGGTSGSSTLDNKTLHEWLTIGVRGVFDVIR